MTSSPIICETCEDISEVNDSKLTKYLSTFKGNNEMKVNKYNLEFFGLCKNCKTS